MLVLHLMIQWYLQTLQHPWHQPSSSWSTSFIRASRMDITDYFFLTCWKNIHHLPENFNTTTSALLQLQADTRQFCSRALFIYTPVGRSNNYSQKTSEDYRGRSHQNCSLVCPRLSTCSTMNGQPLWDQAWKVHYHYSWEYFYEISMNSDSNRPRTHSRVCQSQFCWYKAFHSPLIWLRAGPQSFR